MLIPYQEILATSNSNRLTIKIYNLKPIGDEIISSLVNFFKDNFGQIPVAFMSINMSVIPLDTTMNLNLYAIYIRIGTNPTAVCAFNPGNHLVPDIKMALTAIISKMMKNFGIQDFDSTESGYPTDDTDASFMEAAEALGLTKTEDIITPLSGPINADDILFEAFGPQTKKEPEEKPPAEPPTDSNPDQS